MDTLNITASKKNLSILFIDNTSDTITFYIGVCGEVVGEIEMDGADFVQAMTEYCEDEKRFVYPVGRELVEGEYELEDVIGCACDKRDRRFKKAFLQMLVNSGHIVVKEPQMPPMPPMPTRSDFRLHIKKMASRFMQPSSEAQQRAEYDMTRVKGNL